jgi:hypothetical protein
MKWPAGSAAAVLAAIATRPEWMPRSDSLPTATATCTGQRSCHRQSCWLGGWFDCTRTLAACKERLRNMRGMIVLPIRQTPCCPLLPLSAWRLASSMQQSSSFHTPQQGWHGGALPTPARESLLRGVADCLLREAHFAGGEFPPLLHRVDTAVAHAKIATHMWQLA